MIKRRKDGWPNPKELFCIDEWLKTGMVNLGKVERDLQQKDRVRIVREYQLFYDYDKGCYTEHVDSLWEDFFKNHPRVVAENITSYLELLYYATEKREFNKDNCELLHDMEIEEAAGCTIDDVLSRR